MKIPSENEFLKHMNQLDALLQLARDNHGYCVNARNLLVAQMAGKSSHEWLESAHDALVTLLGMFVEETPTAGEHTTDLCLRQEGCSCPCLICHQLRIAAREARTVLASSK